MLIGGRCPSSSPTQKISCPNRREVAAPSLLYRRLFSIVLLDLLCFVFNDGAVVAGLADVETERRFGVAVLVEDLALALLGRVNQDFVVVSGWS